MTTQPTALRLAAVPICDRSIGWQADATAELRRLHQQEVALNTWLDKTSWVQETARPSELGMHRADAMQARMLKTEAQRDALLEACKTLMGLPGTEDWAATLRLAVERARAAIAKAEAA